MMPLGASGLRRSRAWWRDRATVRAILRIDPPPDTVLASESQYPHMCCSDTLPAVEHVRIWQLTSASEQVTSTVP